MSEQSDPNLGSPGSVDFRQRLEGLRPLMRRSAAAILRRADDVDDAVQEGMLRLLKHGQNFEVNLQALNGLAATTVRRVALDMLARKRPVLSAEPIEPPPAPDQIAPLEHEQLRGRLRQAVDALPDPQRSAFLLVHQEGLSHADAARELRLSAEGLRARLYRARCDLRTSLKDLQ